MTQLFGCDDSLQLRQVVRDRAADDEIIEMFPLGNFVASDAEALLNAGSGILISALQPLLQDCKTWRSEEHRDQCEFQFILALGSRSNAGGALDIDVEEHVAA